KEGAKKLGLVKEKDKDFEGDDLREGMTAILRIKITNPVFEGQTKTKLGSTEAYTMMNDLSYTRFSEWIEDNKELATSIINNALQAAQRREKIKKINDAEKKKIGKGTSPLAGKVAVCTLKDKTVNEFIVVEGDSAGGSAKQARDRRFQTIMPSKGKIMNTEKQKLENVLASEELKIFNTAVGTGTLDNYKESELKYDKIIIMSDADVDGYHIRTLWMTYIYRYMRPLIANGHLYLARPPLYKVYKIVKGCEVAKYAYSDEDLEQVKKEIGKGALMQRYKGLGEMNPDQLWETTLNPASRTLIQVTIDDAAKAERMVSLLMGEIVEPRKKYMYKYGEF
ncbi:MAG: toprim domain-containing protein, partial [Clostridium sp.]